MKKSKVQDNIPFGDLTILIGLRHNLFITSAGIYLKKMKSKKGEVLELLCDLKKRTISEIARELKISYKETHRHIKDLDRYELVKIHKPRNMKHNPCFVSLNISHFSQEVLENYSQIRTKQK